MLERRQHSFSKNPLEHAHNIGSSSGTRRSYLRVLTQAGIAAFLNACQLPAASEAPLGAVSYAHIPHWRGFNLQNKYNDENPAWNRAYDEWQLDFMAEFGFNFVRLPLDYRIWTQSPGVYNERVLKEIDQLIDWARQCMIHVCMCLHRAPGYCVNPPGEPFDLWGSGAGGETARRQFAEQWAMFAERYKGIPAADLSFNLVNEPPDIDGERYVQVVGPAVDAIRRHDAQRLIIADGANYGRRPVAELLALKLAQSTRGYEPFLISHYQAEWVAGAANYSRPVWPVPMVLNQFLYGQFKRDFKSPLILKGSFPKAALLSIRVHQVSTQADLLVSADARPILRKSFLPGPGAGEWKESVFQPEWNNYLANYDMELSVTLPSDTQTLQIELSAGDWLTISQITISPFPGAPHGILVIKADDTQWGVRQEPMSVDSAGRLSAVSGKPRFSRETLWRDSVEPWQRFSVEQRVAVLVGEWGAYNHTPHSVVLAWMQDCLANWRRAGLGWALWELSGSFGVLDSERADVQYESYKGHKLDRKMLELLRQADSV